MTKAKYKQVKALMLYSIIEYLLDYSIIRDCI